MSIPPTVSGSQVILQGVGSGTGTSGATNIPPGILALPNGTLLRGNIVHLDPHSGIATLRTPKGDIFLKSDLPLERGNEVVIRLDTVSAGLKARIISVDGLTPKELEQAYPPSGIVAPDVEDLVDLPALSSTTKPVVPTRATTPAATTPPPPEGIEIPIQDSVEIISQKQPVILRAALLSRSPELPQLLRQLPSSIAIPAQRLEAGSTLTVILIPETITLPDGSKPVLLPPATLPLAATMKIGSLSVPTATPASPSDVLSASLPLSSLPSSKISRIVTTPGGGYAPNPLVPTVPTYTVKINPPISPAAVTITPAYREAAPAALPVSVPTAQPSSLTNLPTASSPAATSPALPSATLSAQPIPATPAPSPHTSLAATIAANITSGTASAVVTADPAAVVAQINTFSATITPANTPATIPTAPHTAPVIAAPTSSPTTPPLPATSTAIPSIARPLTPDTFIADGQLSAQVIGTEQSGEVVLKTPLGTIKTELTLPHGQKLELPPDTLLRLKILALETTSSSPLATSKDPTSPASLSDLSQQWNSLREATNVLQQSHPMIAQHLLQNIIPQPGPKMAKDILFFMLGLKSEENTDWLEKKTLEALGQQNRGDLVRKLSAELSTLKQAFVESPNPNWQSVFVPVQYQGEWQQARLYIKKDKPESAASKDDQASTRFIMEVELSRMGAMQFDGFVKKNAQSTQFDLVIRSAIALPAKDQQAIRDIFTDASQLTGFKGGLSFQVGQPFPIQPLEELLRSDRNVIA